MPVRTREIDYFDGETALQAYMAWDDSNGDARPGVLVSHAWRGRSGFEEEKARKLATLGYVGFALDLYGKGILGSSPEENRALMQPLLDDRPALQRRMRLALQTMRSRPEVNAHQTAAMGFCFGGLCVLDLARCGADSELLGVASFHGLFTAPGNTAGNDITAKILLMHGWDDPMATPQQALELAGELTAAGADWQLHAYGGTTHAFSNPQANDPEHGLVYSELADMRSWDSLQRFLAELFGRG